MSQFQIQNQSRAHLWQLMVLIYRFMLLLQIILFMNIIGNYSKKGAQTLIAEIVNLIILFEEQIQQVKDKICGFNDFSIQTAFKEIDVDGKGYILIEDVRGFLDNKIFAKDIEALFYKYGNAQQLHFLGFLRIIKPYKNKQLTEKVVSRAIKNKLSPQYLTLLAQILILTLVMTGQLQTLKIELANNFCLNPEQIRRLIFGKNTTSNMNRDIILFMKNNGFDISQSQLELLDIFLNYKLQLYDDIQVHQLFLPTHIQPPSHKSDEYNKATSAIPLQTKTNYLNFKHPDGSFPFLYEANHQYNNNRSSRILNEFQSGASEQKNKNYLYRVSKDQQIKNNTPFLDMFMKHSTSQLFYNKSNSKYKNIPSTPYKSPQDSVHLGTQNKSKYIPFNQSDHRPSPIFVPHRNGDGILDDFMKYNRSKQQFSDSVSLQSERAFKYV